MKTVGGMIWGRGRELNIFFTVMTNHGDLDILHFQGRSQTFDIQAVVSVGRTQNLT